VPRSFVKEARKRVGPKRVRIRQIIDRLAAEYPDATIALTSRSPLELLVAVMLSAQTTDVNVNRVTERLFVKYRKPEDYLAVPEEELERDIYATGFYRQKTKAIRGTIWSGCPASHARRQTSSRQSSESRRASSSTPTCAGSRSGSA
jgi:endonuclease III